MRIEQRVRTGLGHGGITCVLQTQFLVFLYIQHYLMDLHHTWDSGLVDIANDLIPFIGHCDLYFIAR